MPSQNPIFIPGPTNIPESVRRALDVPMEDQRAPDFPDFTLPLFADLKRVFKTSDGEALIFPASGTGGWEAALTNLLSPGDKVLTSRLGQFSTLWADMCTKLVKDCMESVLQLDVPLVVNISVGKNLSKL